MFVGGLRSSLLRWLTAIVLLLCLGATGSTYAHGSETTVVVCSPKLLGSWGAKEIHEGQRPTQGWEALSVPHIASAKWTQWQGAVWYRLDWQINCPHVDGVQKGALALAISGMRQAGTVYWNDELLWSDRSLVTPMSRSWNMPRWWPVSTRDRGEVQTAWVRVVAWESEFKGLGYVQLGDMASIRDAHEVRYRHQRLSYVVTGSLSLTIACVALVVWLWRRSEQVYLWMGVMQTFWTLYLAVVLSLDPWPGLGNHTMLLLNVLFFMLYAHCFLVFVFRYTGQHWPKVEWTAWGLLAIWVMSLLWGRAVSPWQAQMSLVWGVAVFNCGCLYAMYRGLRTRKPQQLLLGAVCAVMLVVALHDIVVALRYWDNDKTWSYISWPLNMLVLAVLLGWQVARHMRRIDRFNIQLTEHVVQARTELAQVLAREHAQALQHAKLQERVQIAHDLHDGLGGSLVRSMALLEQAPQQLSNERVLSLFKTLRDDLRQVIDTGSSNSVVVPETPAQWIAPLRHRFANILDEMGIQAQWQVDPAWQVRPTAVQCLALTRFLEEAFANMLKHSRAKCVTVRCIQPRPHTWVLSLEDDGVGFDVMAVLQAGVSVGMRSMQSRIVRIGGSFEVQSRPGCTVLVASVPLVDLATQPSIPVTGSTMV